jgi:hypothetical protein
MAARWLLDRTAWRRSWLGFWVARVRTRRGLNRRLGVAEGLGFNPNRRGVREDHARVPSVFVPVSLGGMTGGVQVSGTERRKGGEPVGGGREVGRGLLPGPGRIWSRGPISPFPIFFLFPFLFYFENWV